MDWLKKLFGHAKHAALAVSHGFEKLVGHDRAVAFAHASVELLKDGLGKIAASAVDEAELLAIPGAEKFAHATSVVASKALEAGLDAKKHEIQLLIQLAVNVLKGSISVP
jgi:hypothetical protein